MLMETPRIWLPRTGQTTSYASGDDGYFKAGNPRKTRFINGGGGTISDRAAGLMWVEKPQLIIPGATGVHATNQIQAARGDWANSTAYAAADLAKDTADSTYWVCAAAHTSASSDTFAADRAAHPTYWRQTVWTASAANLTTPATMTWPNALAYSLGAKWNPTTGLNYAGYTDWRLPNMNELLSMVHWGNSTGPCVDKTVWTMPATPCVYWSSTANPGYTSWKCYCQYLDVMPSVNNNAQTATYYVRPIRGGRLNANG